MGNGEKFPINSYEVYLIAMIMGILAYVIFSFIFYRKPYNMDRLLHRGIYSENPEEYARIEAEKAAIKAENRKGNIFVRFFRWSAYVFFSVLGITPEYTLGDKLIAWVVFLYSIVWAFVFCFLGTLLWNTISPWQIQTWGKYYYVTTVFVPMTLGIVSTVWFMVGGIIDMKALFHDLARKTTDALDNGMVEGEVSLSDKAKFEKLEKQSDNK